MSTLTVLNSLSPVPLDLTQNQNGDGHVRTLVRILRRGPTGVPPSHVGEKSTFRIKSQPKKRPEGLITDGGGFCPLGGQIPDGRGPGW